MSAFSFVLFLFFLPVYQVFAQSARFIFNDPNAQAIQVKQNRLRLLEEELNRINGRQASILSSLANSMKQADLSVRESVSACESLKKNEIYKKACKSLTPTLQQMINIQQIRCQLTSNPQVCFIDRVIPRKVKQMFYNLQCKEADVVAPLIDETTQLCNMLQDRRKIVSRINTQDNPVIKQLTASLVKSFEIETKIDLLKDELMIPSPEIFDSPPPELTASIAPTTTTTVDMTTSPQVTASMEPSMSMETTPSPMISNDMDLATTTPEPSMSPMVSASMETMEPMITDTSDMTTTTPSVSFSAESDITITPSPHVSMDVIISPFEPMVTPMESMIPTPSAMIPNDEQDNDQLISTPEEVIALV